MDEREKYYRLLSNLNIFERDLSSLDISNFAPGLTNAATGTAASTGLSGIMSAVTPYTAALQGIDMLAGFGASFIDYTKSVGEKRAKKEATWSSVPLIGGLGSLFSKKKSRRMQATSAEKDAEYKALNMSNVVNDQKDAASMAFNSASVYSVGGSTSSVYGNGGNTYYATMGGTHEQDPLGGTTISHNANGVPNKIEEGEYVVGDFVFSNRF